MQNFRKEGKQPPVVIQQQSIFLRYIYSMLVAKNHQKIRSTIIFVTWYIRVANWLLNDSRVTVLGN